MKNSKDSTLIIQTAKYVYNSKQQLVTEYWTIADTAYSTTMNYYNEDDNLVRIDVLKPNSQLLYSRLFEYNHRKNKKTYYTKEKSVSHKIHEFQYNQNGQCILITNTYSFPNNVDLFTYHSNGLFFEMKEVEYGRVKKLERHFYFMD